MGKPSTSSWSMAAALSRNEMLNEQMTKRLEQVDESMNICWDRFERGIINPLQLKEMVDLMRDAHRWVIHEMMEQNGGSIRHF